MVARQEAVRKAAPVVILPMLAVMLMGCGGGGGPTPAPTPAPTAPTGPTPAPTAVPTPAPPNAGCLCIFDIDRTLTGKQQETSQCSKNQVVSNVNDVAYGGGDLTLSELGQNVDKSGCKECYIGVISAGGPIPAEKDVLFEHLSANGKLPTTKDQAWSSCVGTTPKTMVGPLVTTCPDSLKQKTVPFILEWYKTKEVYIADTEVYFFDDRESNVHPFADEFSYNAKQISCPSRDPDHGNAIGLCGAELAEIVLEKGTKLCTATTAEEIV